MMLHCSQKEKMRTDVRMRCFYHATAFSEEKKNLLIHLLD